MPSYATSASGSALHQQIALLVNSNGHSHGPGLLLQLPRHDGLQDLKAYHHSLRIGLDCLVLVLRLLDLLTLSHQYQNLDSKTFRFSTSRHDLRRRYKMGIDVTES